MSANSALSSRKRTARLRMTLTAHVARGHDAAFRLKRGANAKTVAFLTDPPEERTVEIRPDDGAPARLKARHPGAEFGPL